MNVPVFPLANVVLFPHTYLPLHVFEPRYRAMVAHALEGSRLIVVVLAREELPPGHRPDIHPIGSVGRIDVINRLEDEFRKVTPDLIRKTASEYLRPTNRTVLTITPKAAAKPGEEF